jgi:Protein of unknown function (DUF3800)
MSLLDSPSRPLSRWLVFCDECGDHSLVKIDPDFPLFLLSLVLVDRREYAERIVPALARFKLDWFDHEGINLHSYEIRKAKGPFALLSHRPWRESFNEHLSRLMTDLPYRAFCVAVRKDALVKRHGIEADNPYDLALAQGVDAVHAWIEGHGGGAAAWVAEARGKREDRDLASTWKHLHAFGLQAYLGETLEFVPGSDNVAGIQLADLIGHPVARHVLNPEGPHRAFEVIEPHLRNGMATRCWVELP